MCTKHIRWLHSSLYYRMLSWLQYCLASGAQNNIFLTYRSMVALANIEPRLQEYVRISETCTHWKHNNTRKNGKMIPIPIPEERWWEKYGLQCAKAEVKRIWCYQEIFRQLVQLVKISACNRNDDAQITACHFSDCVVRHYGLPWIIISYRDSTQKFGHLLLSC